MLYQLSYFGGCKLESSLQMAQSILQSCSFSRENLLSYTRFFVRKHESEDVKSFQFRFRKLVRISRMTDFSGDPTDGSSDATGKDRRRPLPAKVHFGLNHKIYL